MSKFKAGDVVVALVDKVSSSCVIAGAYGYINSVIYPDTKDEFYDVSFPDNTWNIKKNDMMLKSDFLKLDPTSLIITEFLKKLLDTPPENA